MVCEVGSGITAKFWHDNWTGLGPLLDITGPAGPQTVGLPLDAVVRDAIRGNQWWISSSRSRSSTIMRIKNALPEVNNLTESQHDDTYLWKTDHHAPSNLFSASKTWIALNPPQTPVRWHKSVWFSNQIPKHAFISWIAAWNRLATRDRLRNWGCQVPPTCILCNIDDETRDHIFFECEYSAEVWSYFTSRLHLNPPSQYLDCLIWLQSASRDKNISLIIKLIHQAVLYFIWSERNQRLHADLSRPPVVLIREIQQIIRSKLLPLSPDQSSSSGLSPLAAWFGFFPFR